MSAKTDALIAKIERLQAAYISFSTNDDDDGAMAEYEDNRRELVAMPTIRDHLPDFVRRYRSLKQFWPFIQRKFAHYQERREYIYEAFAPVIQLAEKGVGGPSDDVVTQGLASLDAAHVHEMWTKALERRTTDPEGAITATRALLESVLKLVLDEAGEAYADDAELPKLYSQCSKLLKLAPSQHSEQVFRQILGGCQSVVEGMGAVRNRLSDAHGKGKKPVRPAARHAELVVNLGGAMAVFVAATWIEQKAHLEKVPKERSA